MEELDHCTPWEFNIIVTECGVQHIKLIIRDMGGEGVEPCRFTNEAKEGVSTGEWIFL